MTRQTTIALFALAVFLIVGLVFSPNARNALVCYDDYDYLVTNRAIRNGLTPRSIHWSFRSAGYAGNWHPLTWLSHAFDFTVAENLQWRLEDGSCPFSCFIHVENIFLHCANALLLWVLLVLLLAPPDKPFSADAIPPFDITLASFFALLWAVHPLRVEVVAWAAERKELLGVFFMLLTLLCHVGERFLSVQPSTTKQWATTTHLSLIFFTLALLSKPVAVSLPAVILFYDLAIRKRTFSDALRKVYPYAGLSVATCYLTLISQKIAIETGNVLTWQMKIRCAVEAPIVYLSQTFWPMNLCLDYPFPDGAPGLFFALGVVLLLAVATVCFLWFFRRTCTIAVFCVIWAYVGLLPMIGIVKVGYEPHNDRYTYWIGCGIVCCAALVLRRFRPFLLRHARPAAAVGGILLLILSVLSIRQSFIWKDNEAILSDIARKTHHEDAVRSLCELRILRDGESANAQSETLLRETLCLRPSYRARAALAIHLLGYGTDVEPTEEVRKLVAEARKENPNSNWVHVAQALLDYRDGRYAEALTNMKDALDHGYLSALVKPDLQEWDRRAKTCPWP